MEGLLSDNISPEKICFIAFTRKAANEARNRAIMRFGFSPQEVPWFRTLHSLAFTQMGLRRDQVMGFSDYIFLAEKLGLPITLKGLSEDGSIVGLLKGDRLFFMESMARSTKTPLRQYWEEHIEQEDIAWYELKQVQDTFHAYKESRGKYDFIDMLELFIQHQVVPNVEILIVDEAQDLTALQWDAVNLISERCEETYIAGDDDQAIFRWAGADVDHFITLPCKQEVLPKSYRVPGKIQELANDIIQRVETRILKPWKPTEDSGSIEHVIGIEDIDLSKDSWYLLGRNIYLLDQYVQYCRIQGYVYESTTEPESKSKILRAIRLWEALRRGDKITVAEARVVYEYLSSKVGVEYGKKQLLKAENEGRTVSMLHLTKEFGLLTTKIWHEALDRIPAAERDYYVAAIKRGESLTSEPRIKISTIHGVKGGEADHVVICPDMALRTFNEFTRNPDDEHRVWYVAITRARKSVWILAPKSDNCYDFR